MPTKPAVDRFRVTCQDRTTQPMSERGAEALIFGVERSGTCLELHTIEVLVGDEWLPRHIARAREILALPVGATVASIDGALIVCQRDWSNAASDTPACLAARAAGDVDAYRAALGPAEQAVLTADGRDAVRTWCTCYRPADDDESWKTHIRYEVWSAVGRDAHGWLCRGCRRIAQSG